MMEFEADRMIGLVLTDENVLPERDVVLEEHNMRVANNPDARLTEQITAALYLKHPYGRPVIGWHQEIEKLDREDALAFSALLCTEQRDAGDRRRRRRGRNSPDGGADIRQGRAPQPNPGARNRPQEPISARRAR